MQRINFLTRRRLVLDEEVREPTALALALCIAVFAGLLCACVAATAFLPAYGHMWWIFTGVAVVSVRLVIGLCRKRKVPDMRPTARQRWFRRIIRCGRIVLVAMLSSWLALIVWSAARPGGPDPPAKADPRLIRVVTWNIHCGQDEGGTWEQFDWPARKHALRAAIGLAQPDILCVQEARSAQVAFLEETLPGHDRVGVGRDDGRSGGEHCAVYFGRQRFEKLSGGTFWLEEPTDQPRAGSAALLGLDVKRICTWIRLRDRDSGRTIRLYNAHPYLTESPRMVSAKIILAQIAAADPADAVILTADFNSAPDTPSRRIFRDVGLIDSADRAGKPAGKPTFHYGYGIGLWCIDGILVDSHWRVQDHVVLDMKPHNTYPSDHFGLLADLELPERTGKWGAGISGGQ
jgi:endonuclease/exonuclease/phosphatase family metal-dependent hydrolase